MLKLLLRFSLALFFILLGTQLSYSQKLSRSAKKIIKEITKENILQHQYVGYAGITPSVYLAYERLKRDAKTEELEIMLKHDSAAVKGYAAWALADRKYPNIVEVFSDFLRSGEEVETLIGCSGSADDLASTLYYNISHKYYREEDSLSIQDSIYYDSLTLVFNHIVLYSDHESEWLLDHVLDENNANPDTYPRVRELALTVKSSSALAALAKYKKEEDIQLILSNGDVSFRAVLAFPDSAFWDYLESRKELRYKDYFRAVAIYQDNNASNLLEEIMPTCEGFDLKALSSALIENYSPAFQNLILKIWVERKMIDYSAARRLAEDCPLEALDAFKKGLLNTDINFNIIWTDYEYEKKSLTIPLMLRHIAECDSAQLLPICNKNILYANFQELEAVLEFVEESKMRETIPTIMERLQMKNYPFECSQLTKTILSFSDPSLKSKLVEILRNKQADWDHGNWAPAFRKLFKENDMDVV